MEFFMAMPYLVRVLGSLCVILIVNKITRGLSVSIIAGIAVLALWTGQSFQSITAITWGKFSSASNLALITAVLLVIWLSKQMSASGVMQDLVKSINSRVSRRASMALLPAVIGLLPMPGGAIFSAPLVDESDWDKTIDPLLKTQINYWFRHVWEYWWPLYPGVLLAIEITGLPIFKFMIIMLPLSIVSVLAGYLFFLRRIPHSSNNKKTEGRSDVIHILILLMPIIIIILCFIITHIFFPAIPKMNKYFPMILGIVLAQILLQIQRPISIKKWGEIIFSMPTVSLFMVVAFVLIYGAFVDASLPDGTRIMEHVSLEIGSIGIPVVLVIVLIPFIAGMTTGIAVGFVGASFPIVMSLLGNNYSMTELLSAAVLAYGSGYMGMILSPVHVCLIVTNDYFKTGIIESIIRLSKPALVVFTGTAVIYMIITFFF